MAAPGFHPHALQALGVAADMVDGDARLDLILAVVKGGAPGEHLAHHGDDVVDFERQLQRRMAHAAAGSIGHLDVLQVIVRPREKIVIADMVVMQVADDDRP